MSEILIVSGGPEQGAFEQEYIRTHSFSYIIAADAGMKLCREAGLLPDLILGDFDSADSDCFAYFHQRIPERMKRYPVHKDETDTELALNAAIARWKEHPAREGIVILSALGGRVDHLLGNIQLLETAVAAGVSCRLINRQCSVRMIDRDTVLRRQELFGRYVSLIPYGGPVRGLTLTGFEYCVQNFTLQTGRSRGISNELREETGTISMEEGRLLVIEASE